MGPVSVTFLTIMYGCGSSVEPEQKISNCCMDTDPYVVPSSAQPRTGIVNYYIEPSQAAISGSARSVGLLWKQITRGDTTFERVTNPTEADFLLNCNYVADDPLYLRTLDSIAIRADHTYSILVNSCNNTDELRTTLFHIFGHEAGIPDMNAPGKFHYIMRTAFVGRPGGLPGDVELTGLTSFFDSRRASKLTTLPDTPNAHTSRKLPPLAAVHQTFPPTNTKLRPQDP